MDRNIQPGFGMKQSTKYDSTIISDTYDDKINQSAQREICLRFPFLYSVW